MSTHYSVYPIDRPVVKIVAVRSTEYQFTVKRYSTYSAEVTDPRGVSIEVHGSDSFIADTLKRRAQFIYKRAAGIAASLLFYIVRNFKPATPTEPCMGWMSAHYNLPADQQTAPAVAYIGVRHVCEHCKAAHDRAMAHLAGLQAATPAPQYTAYVEAA